MLFLNFTFKNNNKKTTKTQHGNTTKAAVPEQPPGGISTGIRFKHGECRERKTASRKTAMKDFRDGVLTLTSAYQELL